MIQETVHRLSPVLKPDHLLIVTGRSHAVEIGRQLPEIDQEQIIIEPAPRGTGPAIGLAVALIAQENPDAIVGSFAADHHVLFPERFITDVRAAMAVASEGYLVTIGIEPSYPETGYGYIKVGDEIGTFAGEPVHRVDRFREKPDLETAKQYLADGGYLWNASMFVWRASTLLDEMQRLLPDVHRALMLIAGAWGTDRSEEVFAATWPEIEQVTIDHGILEHSTHVAVVPSQMGWSDLGDWHSVGTLKAQADEPNTVVDAEVLSEHSRDNLIYGNRRVIGLVGVEGLVVVDTDDALLICDRTRAQDVKDIVEQLKSRGMRELL